jgi:hypothetical protein
MTNVPSTPLRRMRFLVWPDITFHDHVRAGKTPGSHHGVIATIAMHPMTGWGR